MVVFIVVFIFVVIAAFLIVYDVCFSGRKAYMSGNYSIPKGEQFQPYSKYIREAIDEVLGVPYELVYTTSFDGLKLAGKYYHMADDAPLIIFFHGYRCSSLRDGNGVFRHGREMGCNVLLVDQRAHGMSEGTCITFGVKERYDVLSWVNYGIERLGKETKILLSGLSMGAATVLMAADVGLPENVRGIVADCPYSSPKEILCTVMKALHFPVVPTYWMAKWGAKVIGKFDLEEASAVEAIKNSDIPILIVHGDDDRFVPCEMSKACRDAACDHVELVLVKDAGHGMSYFVDRKVYKDTILRFLEKTLCSVS